jgi:rhodanese-related sulfurtransferase
MSASNFRQTTAHPPMIMHPTTAWAGAALLLLAASGAALAAGQRCLSDLERKVAEDHPHARSLTAEQFETRLAAGDQVVVFDVRDKTEFDVSRLAGAIRVDPGITATEFMRRHGASVAGKTVLLYCSVGVRSSRLAQRIDRSVRAAGSNGAFNLLGGVFSWHNTGRRLVSIGGDTDKVHAFNRDWAQYLDFNNLAVYGRGWGW